MKIAEVSQYYPPYRGGQEAYVGNLSRHLAAMGHQVTVLTTTPLLGDELPIPGVRVVRDQSTVAILNNPITFSVLRHARVLRSCDVVHAHNEHSFMTMLAAMIRSRINRPLALTLHGQLSFGNRALDGFERTYSKTIGNLILRRVDRVFVDSEDTRAGTRARGIPASMITVVPNAIDEKVLEAHVMDGARDYLGRTFGINEDTRIVLFVGRLILRKGVRTLLAAFEQCLSMDGNLLLVIVGDGQLLSWCTRVASDGKLAGKVVVLTNISDQDLYRMYQAADVFVLPSLSEGCPTALLEAMYFGCSVVASDIRGIREHFASVATLVPPKSVSAFTDAILSRAYQNRDDASLKLAAKNMVTLRFNWRNSARVYSDALESLCS